MRKTLLRLAVGLFGLTAAAQGNAEPIVKTFSSIADTWVRSNNTGWNRGGSGDAVTTKSEEVTEGEGDEMKVTGYTQFAALLGFDFELPQGMIVEKAVMRLVTTVKMSDSEVLVHSYPNNFDEGASWKTEGQFIISTYNQKPAVQFKPNGQPGRKIWENRIPDDMKNLTAWTNEVDITSLLANVSGECTRVNFVIYQELDKKGGEVSFYSREAKDFEGNFTATAAGLTPQLTVTYVQDTETVYTSLNPTGDTFIRSTAAGKNYGADGGMELGWAEIADTAPAERGTQFCGLISFTLPEDVEELKSARLRVGCTINRGDRDVNIYAYPTDFEENTATWNSEHSKVEEALKTNPIASFLANGQGGKAIWQCGDDFKDASKWITTIDLTKYAKDSTGRLNLLLDTKNPHGDKSHIVFATKEATDTENGDYIFPAEDFRPQLFISYKKKDNTTGATTFTIAEDNNAPIEYYNINGMRVINPANGIFIKRQGTKVEKVIIR